MSIFNRTSLIDSINEIDVEPYEGYIEPTMESVAEINAELNESVYKLNTSLYVADLLLEQRAQAGEDVEALMEAAVGDFFSKMIKKIKDMWAKIKTFFRNLGIKIKELTSGGKKFINKYEKGILKAANNKDAKWIEYHTKFTLNVGRVLDGTVTALNDSIMHEIKIASTETTVDDLEFESERIERSVCKWVKAETYDEAKKNITKEIKGDDSNTKETLNKDSVIEMLDWCKNYTNGGAVEIRKHAKYFDNYYTTALSALNHFKTNSAKKYNPEDMSIVTKYIELVNKAISFGHWVSSYYTKMISNQYIERLSVLKSFVSANSSLVKGSSSESKDNNKEDAQTESSYSLLENILETF